MGPRDDQFEDSGIKHYWGDAVRQLLVVGAVVILLGSPFYVGVFGSGLVLNIIAVLVIVAFAALTNPLKRWIIMADAVIAGVGVVLFGSWAVASYGVEDILTTVASAGLALVFLSAFYFSIKTLRSMLLDQIDVDEQEEVARESEDEPEDEADDDDDTPSEERYEFTGALPHKNKDERAEMQSRTIGGRTLRGDITDEAPNEEFSE